MQNVTQLKIAKPTKSTAPKARSRKAKAITRHAPATGLGVVILVLIGLSLSHLAHGVAIVTGCDGWEALAMAIGLDLLIVGLECAMVATAGSKASKPVAKFANPALIVAFVWSAGLNAFAFSAASDALPMQITAASLGATIPMLIYASTRAWAALAINSKA